MKRLAALLLALVCAGCVAGRITASAAQLVLAPYSVEAQAAITSDAGVGPGLIAANAQGIAIDAMVSGTVRIYAPDPVTGARTLVKEITFDRKTGRRAYALDFSGPEVVKLVKREWSDARSWMPYLPE